MKRVAIVQARMGSTRLQGKVLRPLAGSPMLHQQLARVDRASRLDEVVVATSAGAADDPIAAFAADRGIRCVRGSEHDVLSRYRKAAHESGADLVVRITADCPLIEPSVIDRVVAELEDSRDADYASNVIERSYPQGLDVEAFWRDVLDRVDRMAGSAPAREHVTYFIVKERPDLFEQRSVVDAEDNSDLRWTVDTEDDFMLVERLYDDLDLGRKDRSYAEILDHVRSNPDISRINAHVRQKIA